jgi:hypothetical protein
MLPREQEVENFVNANMVLEMRMETVPRNQMKNQREKKREKKR